jgi:hypothetical protein
MTNPHNSQQAFYNLNDFPKLKALADNWQTIRDEFQILNAPDMGINRTGQEISAMQAQVMGYVQDGGQYGWGDGLNSSLGWSQYCLMIQDGPYPLLKPPCPKP